MRIFFMNHAVISLINYYSAIFRDFPSNMSHLPTIFHSTQTPIRILKSKYKRKNGKGSNTYYSNARVLVPSNRTRRTYQFVITLPILPTCFGGFSLRPLRQEFWKYHCIFKQKIYEKSCNKIRILLIRLHFLPSRFVSSFSNPL